MAVLERQHARRRPHCPFIFHGRNCGKRQPCLGAFRKTWHRACEVIGMKGRIPHDLRRSGVKHYIEAGVPPHIVMQWSGHRTLAMLHRYAIIDLDDLRRAGKQASEYQGARANVLPFGRTRICPSKIKGGGEDGPKPWLS